MKAETLEEIYNRLETNATYNKTYQKLSKEHPWIFYALNDGYEAMCKKIKLRGIKKEYLDYDSAATIMDIVVLSVSAVYDEKIRQLEDIINVQSKPSL